MRRFSQRNQLVTLSEINITPLLDLAFVLLIIFIITTPLLEKSINLNLPAGGKNEPQKPSKQDIRTIEISTRGQYRLRGTPMSLVAIERELVQAWRANPNIVIYVRADKNCPFEYPAAVFDFCERHGINRMAIRTQPDRH